MCIFFFLTNRSLGKQKKIQRFSRVLQTVRVLKTLKGNFLTSQRCKFYALIYINKEWATSAWYSHVPGSRYEISTCKSPFFLPPSQTTFTHFRITSHTICGYFNEMKNGLKVNFSLELEIQRISEGHNEYITEKKTWKNQSWHPSGYDTNQMKAWMYTTIYSHCCNDSSIGLFWHIKLMFRQRFLLLTTICLAFFTFTLSP